GVIVVTYNSSDVVLQCLQSLVGSRYPHLKIVVCDNGSQDDTVAAIRGWAQGTVASRPGARTISFDEYVLTDATDEGPDTLPTITLVRSALNRGYAGGVNVGLRILRRYGEIGMFWILNPDCVVT